MQLLVWAAARSSISTRPTRSKGGPRHAIHRDHDPPPARDERPVHAPGGPPTRRQPHQRGHRRTHGPGRRTLPPGLPRPGAGGAAGRHRPYRTGLRRRDALLHHHPGIIRPGLRNAVGGQGQLAHGADAEPHLERLGGHSHSRRLPRTSRLPDHHQVHRNSQGRVRRPRGRHWQDHGAVDPGLPRLWRGALPS